jgi:hypothetical protein
LDLDLEKPVWQIGNTRLKNTESLGVITRPGDEAVGLSDTSREKMQELIDKGKKQDIAARLSRPPEEGLILIYPISKSSGYERGCTKNRARLFEKLDNTRAHDLIGIAISFPESKHPQPVEAYLMGTVGWRLFN